MVEQPRFKLASAIGVVLLILGAFYYNYSHNNPATDDAYVNANVVHVSSQVTGPVEQTYITDQARVKKGQLLLTIDPAPFLLAVQKADADLKLATQNVGASSDAIKANEATVAERQAELANATKDAERMLPLVSQGRIAPTQGDAVIRKQKVASAALIAAINELHEAQQKLGEDGPNNALIQQSKAAYDNAVLDLQHTKIYAPADGFIQNFSLRPGSLITAYQPLFVLVETNDWWVDANYKETQIRRIKRNQLAEVRLDIYPHHVFKGVVVGINRGSGSAFSLLPAENATGNWVKVTQRFSVKIQLLDLNKHYPLRIGASANAVIHTKKHLAPSHS